MKSEDDRRISIEDILRLKRAERPPAEFWTTFDRELRAKQLSALVGKRPWWQNFPKTFPLLFRFRIPLGASAVIALTLVSLRDDRAKPEQVVAAPSATSAAVSEVTSIPVAVVAPTAPDLPLPAENLFVVASQAAAEPSVIPAAIPQPAEVRASVALGGGLKLDASPETPSPSAVEIAANLAVLRANEPAVSQTLLAQNNGFEVRHASVRPAVEPLQQMTPPGESRRLRILTAMVASASSEASYRTTERAASRIPEERLYDQIQRLGARGDRVQWKF
jgi:hypothetical protein